VIAQTKRAAIIQRMRQIITRVDDDLHARLKQRAAEEGVSLNAFVVDALETALEAGPSTPRERLRRRAKRLGIEFVKRPPGTPPPDDERRDRLIESLRDVHITDEELLEWMRGPHQ
jgi:hypothetical protein